jgi:hypothetical protein
MASLRITHRRIVSFVGDNPWSRHLFIFILARLLGPVSERSKKFWLGNREYDPEKLGYRTEELSGGFKFDTSKPGNSNAGHEFSDTPGPGVIGPALKPDEKAALMAYLKTL